MAGLASLWRVSLLLAFTIAAAAPPTSAGSEPGESVVINEFVSSNASGLSDENGDYSDWIELYNLGTEDAALQGWGLSDNPANPFKWIFPAVTLGPGQYKVVFASSKNRTGPPLHTSFSISAGGETLVLTRPDGTTIDTAPATAMPTDVSLGREPDGTGPWLYFESPTHGASNGEDGYQGAGPVQYSAAGGWYPDPFALELEAEGNSVIHYTLDGSTPDGGSPVYEHPIAITDRVGDPNYFSLIQSSPDILWHLPAGEIRKATVVRTVAIRPGVGAGPVLTHTYFVGVPPEGGAELPVFSVAIDEDSFWDYEQGIYVPGKIYDDLYDPTLSPYHHPANYTQSGDAWERRASLEMFEVNGSTPIRQEIGVRINGGATRAAPRKSLRLYARSEYGASMFEHEFFPGNPLTSFKRLVLRNCGNDALAGLIRDPLQLGSVAGTELVTQATRPAIIYINGEYWGIHYIYERIDKYFLASHYGVDPEAVDMLALDGEVDEGDATDFLALRSFILEQDLVDPANYDWVTSKMDVDEYITYFAAEIYFRNIDWPQNNIDYWRAHTPDARWRWILYDLDFGYGFAAGPESWKHDSLRRVASETQDVNSLMFQALLGNPTFQTRFLVRYADLMNSVFVADKLLARIDALQAEIAPAMADHIFRWREPVSVGSWNQEVDRLRSFAVHRRDFLRPQAAAFFGLAGTVNVTVRNDTPDLGTVHIGTLDLDDETFPWTGVYFSGVPLTARGVAVPGYHFYGFEGLPVATDGSAQVVPAGDIELVAIFGPPPVVCGDGVVEDAEQCDDGNTAVGDGCDADCRPSGSCPAAPLAGCVSADLSTLELRHDERDSLHGSRDRARYRWKNEAASTLVDFDDPVGGSAVYSWCVFEAGGLVLGVDIPAAGVCDGRPCWKSVGRRGFRFRDDSGVVKQIKFSARASGSAFLQLKANGHPGEPLSLALPLLEPVSSQFVINGAAGQICLESVFPTALTNQPNLYEAVLTATGRSVPARTRLVPSP